MLRKFFALNRKACKKIEPYLPQASANMDRLYERTVAQYMNSKRGQVVADVGGGKSCIFAKYREPGAGAKIIAVDISEEELEQNIEVQEKRVTDITKDLPFSPGEVDLIVSRSVLEHLENVDSFIANSKRVLKKGGYFIHLFPSKFAPFALINQALPDSISSRVLYFFMPASKGRCGFPAYYDNCYYSSITNLLDKHGFKVVHTHLSYYQSPYFYFFLPLYLISALYEIVIQALDARNLCAYVLIVAENTEIG